jgi:hypothetical protein
LSDVVVTLDSTFLNNMAEQEGLKLEQEQTIITDQELLCYKPNTQILLLAADHEKNKVGKPFLIFCNNNLQVGD